MKRIIISFIVVLLVISLSFTCFADLDYNYTLRELLTIGSMSAYRADSSGTTYNSNWEWSTDNWLNITSVGSDSPVHRAFGFVISSFVPGGDGISPLFSVERNEYFYFHADYFSFAYDCGSLNPATSRITLDIEFKYVLDNGSTKTVKVFSGNPDYKLKDGTVAYYEFTDVTYSFNIPNNYIGVSEMNFCVKTLTPSAADGTVSFGANNITMFIGDKANAPIYSGADNSTVDQYHDQEQSLISGTSEGRDELGNIFNRGKNFFEGGLGIMEGTLAVSSILTLFASVLNVEGLLYLSLALGIFAFVVGMSQFLVSHLNKGNKVSKKGGG